MNNKIKIKISIKVGEESHKETSTIMDQAESTKHGMPYHESRNFFR